jgi:hypothetical protein
VAIIHKYKVASSIKFLKVAAHVGGDVSVM